MQTLYLAWKSTVPISSLSLHESYSKVTFLTLFDPDFLKLIWLFEANIYKHLEEHQYYKTAVF